MTDEVDVSAPDPARMAWYELSDLGNARRLRDLAMGKLLWVEDHWIAYDGRRWSREDGKRLAQRLAHDVATHISEEAKALAELVDSGKVAKDDQERHAERIAALFKHGIMSGNTNKTAGMLAQAQSELFAVRDDFDRDPLAFNCLNGTLRFREVEQDGQRRWAAQLDPHEPADMISRIADVEYDSKAAAPRWAEHMTTVLPDATVRDFFQQCAGYALTGETREQCIFLLQGKGGDGKSTTMNVIRDLMGGYASNADVQTFMAGSQRSGGEATPDLARMAGDTRMVSTGEPRPGGALDEGRIKGITGGAAITVRELHGMPFEYVPHYKVFFECNRKPRISGDDDGIWRRVIVIQFPHQFKGSAADKQAQRRLLEERSGVLGWMVAGTLSWLEAGILEAPQAVQEAIDDYRRAANPFGEWFAERVDTHDPQARTSAKELYDSYKTWCEANAVGDRELMSSTMFGRAMSDKQIPKMKGAQGLVFRRGARLRSDNELFGDSNPPMRQAPSGGPSERQSGDPGGQPDDYDDIPPDWSS